MRPFTIALCALALVATTAAPGNAGKTDREKYAAALGRYVPSLAELFDPNGPFNPKGMCLCNDGSNRSGVLFREASLTVFCAVPLFLPDGSFADTGSICAPFTVLAK